MPRCGEPQLRGGEQAVDDHVVAAHPVVRELRGLTLRTDNEQRRQLALGDPAGKLDVDLAVIVKGPRRSSGRIVALDRISGSAAPRESGFDWRRSAMSWSCGYCQETEAM